MGGSHGLAPHGLDLRGHLVQVGRGPGGQHHVRAGASALHGDGPAQPPADAADHHHLVLQHQPSILSATAAWRAAIRSAYCLGVTRACSW